MVHVEEYPIDKAGKGEVSSTQPEDNWDLSGTASEWLVRYADQLTEDEKEEIVLGMEAGLSDEMIKVYFTLKDAKKMKRWREVLQRRNEKEEDKNHE